MVQLIDLMFMFFEKLMSFLEGTIDKAMKNYGRVAQEILSFFYTIASILLVDETGKHIILRSSSDPQNKVPLVRCFKVSITEESIISQVINQNEAEIIEVFADSAGEQPGLLQPTIFSTMVVPIASGNQVIGAINIQTTQPYACYINTVHVFQILAYQYGTYLEIAAP